MLMVIDGNNLFVRAYHATDRQHLTANGESTAALTAFTGGLTRILREHRPDRLVFCWDGGGSAYRTRLLPDYKGNRNGSPKHSEVYRQYMKQTRQFLALSNIHQCSRPGFEADDLVARYWFDAEEEVLIVSNDKDFFQLTGPNPQGHECRILRISSGGVPNELWDAKRVEQHTKVPPVHIPSWMALTGDDSDNVPGVHGIGPVRAAALLRAAGWVLDAVEDPSVRQARSQVLKNRLLVNLRLPVPDLELPPVPPFEPTGSHSALFISFEDFLKRYSMQGMLGRLYRGELWADAA